MPEHKTGRPLALALLVALVLLGGAGYGAWRLEHESHAEARQPPPVPVEVASATRRGVPVYLTGIGTVEPFNTVTVSSRVDGELQQVLFREGQDIAKGAPLAVIDPRTFQAALDEAKAKLLQDQAALANAELILKRDAQLGKDDFTSRQTVDNDQSTVDQLQAQVAQDQAAVATAETQLSYTRIAAPIDGRAGLRLIDQGNIVHASDPTGLVVLNQIHPIAVISTLPQRDVPTIRTVLAAGEVEAHAMSRDDGSVLDVGTVALIDNQIEPQSGTLRVKSIFPNDADRLWPGQFVDVKIRVATLPAVVTVPSDAVQRGPDGPYVFIVATNGAVDTRPVKVGQIADGIAVIESGLDAGQEVVVRGQYRLAPGTRIAPSPFGAGG